MAYELPSTADEDCCIAFETSGTILKTCVQCICVKNIIILLYCSHQRFELISAHRQMYSV